jgi:hypothetical protein
MNRRRFMTGLAGILAAGAAPAFVPMGSLMVPQRVMSDDWLVPDLGQGFIWRVARGQSVPLMTWDEISTITMDRFKVVKRTELVDRMVIELDRFKDETRDMQPVIYALPDWPDFDTWKNQRKFG